MRSAPVLLYTCLRPRIRESLETRSVLVSDAHVTLSSQETPSAFIRPRIATFSVAMRVSNSDCLPSESTSPKTQPRALLLAIQYRLRCRFTQFKLCAHLL